MSARAPGDRRMLDLDRDLDLEGVAQRVRALVDEAEGVSIVVEEAGLLVTVAAVGTARTHLGRVSEVDRTFTGAAVRTGSTMVCDDVAANRLVEPGLRRDPRAGSMVSTPLTDGEIIIGLLVLLSARKGAFSPESCRRIERIGVGVALTLADALRRHGTGRADGPSAQPRDESIAGS